VSYNNSSYSAHLLGTVSAKCAPIHTACDQSPRHALRDPTSSQGFIYCGGGGQGRNFHPPNNLASDNYIITDLHSV